jgi:rhodanese-related sulfurtransferase
MGQFFEFILNHPYLWAGFFALLFLLIKGEINQRRFGVRQLGPVAVTQLLSHEDAVLIDVREDNEFDNGHIASAIHIPLKQLKDRIGELEKYKDRPLVAYCRSGSRSGSAGNQLRKAGFESVYNLAGGILAWESANLPVTRK